MITVTIDKAQIEKLKQSLGDKAKNFKKDIAVAVNATAKKVQKAMAREVSKELATPIKVIAGTISIPRKASQAQHGATVRLTKTKRISLKEFGARQTKKGVSYRISKSQGRKLIRSAFIVDRIGGHVFTRVGKSRLPIDKKMGPSPWGVFVGRQMRPAIIAMAKVELKKQIERRIRFQTLKRTGAI